jgi:ribosomal protein S18 acetylase RimI-like enzyme
MDMATVHQFVRRAVAGDLPAILRVDHVAASGDRERAEFLQRSVDLGECLVYVAGEVVAGFVIVQPAHFFGRDFIELLVVDPDRRRSGIGRILLRDAVASAGTAQVFTSTNASNRPMRALLAAEDWSFSGGLGGLDEDDSELVFYKNRPAGPGHRTV